MIGFRRTGVGPKSAMTCQRLLPEDLVFGGRENRISELKFRSFKSRVSPGVGNVATGMALYPLHASSQIHPGAGRGCRWALSLIYDKN